MSCTLQGEAWEHFVMESKFIVQVSQVTNVFMRLCCLISIATMQVGSDFKGHMEVLSSSMT